MENCNNNNVSGQIKTKPRLIFSQQPVIVQEPEFVMNERQKIYFQKVLDRCSELGWQCLSTYYVDNRTKMKFICNKGHEIEKCWHEFKSGCSMCSGNSPIKAKKDFFQILQDSGYKLSGEYINNSTKVLLMCLKGHEYKVVPSSFKVGRRCKKCAGLCPIQAEEQFRIIIDSEKYEIIGDYVDSRTKVECICSLGHRVLINPSSFKIGHRCIRCARKCPEQAGEEFIQTLEDENYQLLEMYKGYDVRVETICPRGHHYFATAHSFKSGYRCIKCAGTCPKQAEGKFVNLVEQSGYTLHDRYINDTTKIEIECINGHKYFTSPGNFKGGSRCTICPRKPSLLFFKARDGFNDFLKSEGYTLLGIYRNS